MTESEACVAFNLTAKIGSVSALNAKLECGSLAAAWESLPNKSSRSGGQVNVEREYELAEKYNIKIVTMVDDGYPEMLKNTPGRPLVLYVKGSLEALNKPSVAIIGTRRASEYGLSQASRFGYDLAKDGWSVVSGLALGIDAASHRGALDADGVTVGVLGSALDRFYPEKNRELAREIIEKNGAVISQFPFGRGADTQTFPMRNHVVAGLAGGVIAIECPHKSGTLITTSIAADLGRVVMAVPGRLDNPLCSGCLSLIRDGAILVRGSKDVMLAMGATKPKKEEDDLFNQPQVELKLPSVSPEEALIMNALSVDPITVDEVVERTGLDISQVNSLCMMLRVKDRIEFLSGNRVSLPRRRMN